MCKKKKIEKITPIYVIRVITDLFVRKVLIQTGGT